MIKNFNFKMLIALSIQAFVLSFMFLSSALENKTDRVSGPVGGLFSAVAGVAGFTAFAIRSINRRLDAAGIVEDPEHPISKCRSTTQEVAGNDADKSVRNPQ